MDIDDILADLDASHAPQESNDLQLLTRHWIAERCAPELLPYPTALMDRILSRISTQITLIEDTTGIMDPRTNFNNIIIQTELERFKFMVRSLLRARIAKIDSHALHYSMLDDKEVLSATEFQYLTHHQSLLSQHYTASFLGGFPAQLQRLDDTAGGISMVERPDTERAVFVRVLRDCGEVVVPGTDVRAELRRGDVWVLRWSVVKEKVLGGDVEVI